MSILQRRLIVAAFGLIVLGVPLPPVDAQAPVQQPSATQSPALPDVRFEVASIRRNKAGEAERAALPAFAVPFPGRSQSQLGLTLRPAEGPVDILVIESIDHPTEN